MGKINGWDKTNETKTMILWEKGKTKPNPLHMRDKFIRITKTTPYIRREFGNKWDVDAYKRINQQTIHGKVRSFKSKEEAMKFVMAFMRKN